MPVDRVTIHHQGGGPPTDNSSGYSYGGYTYGIGSTRWERFRSVAESFATLNYNGESLDICLSGSRGNTNPAYPVTDNDIELIRGAVTDCRNRGEVTDHPDVIPHRNSPGSSTACPGDNAMARWNDIVDACQAGSKPPKPEPEPEPEVELQQATELNEDGRPESFAILADKKIWHRWRVPGGAWSDWSVFSNGPYDGALSVWRNQNGCLEVSAHHESRGFIHRWQVQPNNGWSEWADY